MVTGLSILDHCGYSSITLFLDLATFLLTDYKGEFKRKLAAQPSEVVLLRPDAYIAFRADSLKADAVETNWRRWLKR